MPPALLGWFDTINDNKSDHGTTINACPQNLLIDLGSSPIYEGEDVIIGRDVNSWYSSR